jgi:hypothetical protein
MSFGRRLRGRLCVLSVSLSRFGVILLRLLAVRLVLIGLVTIVVISGLIVVLLKMVV